MMILFQDVSDRVEKDDQESLVLQALEQGAHNVVRDDWRNVIDSEVAQDLRKYRNYRGTSVRDLLRALRNKVSKVFLLMCWKEYIKFGLV